MNPHPYPRCGEMLRFASVSPSNWFLLISFPSRAPNQPQVEVTDSKKTISPLIDVDSPHVSIVPSDYESQPVKTTTQAERLEREVDEDKNAKAANEWASPPAKQAPRNAGGSAAKLNRNKTNPVVLGNAILITAAGATLGFGAYQKHIHGTLTWKLVGLWSGALGAVGFVDYFVSK